MPQLIKPLIRQNGEELDKHWSARLLLYISWRERRANGAIRETSLPQKTGIEWSKGFEGADRLKLPPDKNSTGLTYDDRREKSLTRNRYQGSK